MSIKRDSYSIVRIGQIIDGSIKVDRVPMLISTSKNPVKFIKTYGLITDKTIDDTINLDSGKPDYLFKIDDGTGSLWIKTTSRIAESLKKWDFIRVLGYVNLDTSNGKDYELMVISDGIYKVNDYNWELVHILESLHNRAKKKAIKPSNKKSLEPSTTTKIKASEKDNETSEEPIADEEQITGLESIAQKIERILRENDSGNGVEFSVIMGILGSVDESEVDDVLFELAYEGKVYQPRPDYYKIMD